VLVALIALLLPSTRGRLLGRALDRADDALPGTLTVATASWPSLGRIELGAVSWADGDTLLARADTIAVSVHLRPLVRRDLVVDALLVNGLFADVPAISARFAGNDDSTTDVNSSSAFPRPGAIGGVPSFAVHGLELAADSIRVGPSDILYDVNLVAAAGVLQGQAPEILIERFTAVGGARRWGIEEMSLDVDLARGVVDGSARGHLAERWPFAATLKSERANQFEVIVSEPGGAGPPAQPGVHIVADVDRDGLSLVAVKTRVDLRTPETTALARDPALSKSLAALPGLGAVSATTDATVSFRPALSATATIRARADSLLDDARVELSYRPGVLNVTAAQLELTGLSLEGTARATSDSLGVDARLRARGTDWLRRVDVSAPDTLAADLTATIRGAMRERVFAVTLDGSGHGDGIDVRTFRAFARVSPDSGATSTASIAAHVSDYHVAASASLERAGATVLRITPIDIRTHSFAVSPNAERTGVVRMDRDGAIAIDNVQIAGAFGNASLQAMLDASRRGRVALRTVWPTPPAPLASAFGLRPEQEDTLSTLWNDDGPFHVKIGGDVDLSGSAPDVRLRTEFRLPAPRTLSPLLFAGASVSDLGPVLGTGSIAAAGDSVRARLDMGATGWIDTALASVRWSSGAMSADTLTLVVDAVRVAASGVIDGGQVSATAEFEVGSADWLRRFAPGIPDLAVRGNARVGGTTASPEGWASVEGQVAGVVVEAAAQLTPEGAEAKLVAPDGVSLPHVNLDRAAVTLKSSQALPEFFPVRVVLDARGTDMAVHETAHVTVGDSVVIAVDTLGIELLGRDLHTRRPFVVVVRPDSGGVIVDDLDMTGSMGHVNLSGIMGGSTTRLDGVIAVDMPPRPEALRVPDALWPDNIDASARATSNTDVDLNITIGGITLANGKEPDITASISSTSTGGNLQITVVESADTLLQGSALIPAIVSLAPATFRLVSGELDANLRARDFPVAIGRERRVALIEANAWARGPMEGPDARGEVTVAFADWPALEGYRLECAGGVNDGTPGIAGELKLIGPQGTILDGSASYPAGLSLTPLRLTPVDGQLYVVVDSENLKLDEFAPLLPPEVALDGTLAIHVVAEGPRDNPKLDGRIAASDVEVSMSQRLRLVSSGEIVVGGDARKPSARGDIVVENGLIRIPDPPKDLHPTEGAALLIEGGATSADSAVVEPQPRDTTAAAPVGDVDITVNIPSGLWIRGQGLEAELSGELRIRLLGDHPVLTGQLRAVRGNLVLLGRRFDLDRGSVVFYGDDEANPSLDVQLMTLVDGVTVRVSLLGTALEPELSLTSEPEMPEGDIMSYLVFGRPLDNLDQDQVNLVERRATEIAAAMGAARLQEGLSESLGVDMVTIRSGTTAEESGAVVVGKYLNPRLLIKYERLLEKQAAQFVNLEYSLTRRFKVDALYGRNDQQAIGIEWSNEY
jgi:hypothetical protein